jgi:multicomponent Na+:H+ antiporter subunit D
MLLFVAFPMVLAGLMPLIGKISKRNLPDALTCIVLFGMMVLSGIFASAMNPGAPIYHPAIMGQELSISLAFDGLSFLMLFTIYLVGFLVAVFSIDYMESYGSKANYYALFLLMIAGMSGLVLATDLFTIYIFLEVSAIASYGLVAFGLGYEELEASFKYLMLSAFASALVLLGIVLAFAFTGSVDFAGLFIAGFGLKAALVPFHAWIPDAYTASPATLPALSSGLLIKVAGVYAMCRIFLNVFGLPPELSTVMVWLGVISIVVGALLAMGQKETKRMFAYSSVSQVGYIVLGIGLGTPLGIMGGLFHLFSHSIFKSLLFLNAGSIENATGTRDFTKLGGLGARMPVTSVTSLVGCLSLAGVPPFNGFWSKLLIVLALVELKMYFIAVIAVLTSILTLWYCLLFQRAAFFGKFNTAWSGVKESPFWMRASMICLALLCLVTGLVFPLVMRGWIEPAAKVLSSGVRYLLYCAVH